MFQTFATLLATVAAGVGHAATAAAHNVPGIPPTTIPAHSTLTYDGRCTLVSPTVNGEPGRFDGKVAVMRFRGQPRVTFDGIEFLNRSSHSVRVSASCGK